MADWRNADDYAYTASLTLVQWAWEFLRRGAVYRDLWARHAKEQRVVKALAAGLNRGGANISVGPFPSMKIFAEARALGIEGSLVDPTVRSDEAADLRLRWDSGLRLASAFQKSPAENLPQTSMVATFDLRRSIPEQIREAEQILTGMQTIAASVIKPVRLKHVKVEPDRWKLYLRLLDAKEADADASMGVIGKALFGPKTDRRVEDPKDSAKNALRKARAMVDGGYRDLLRPRTPKKQGG